MPSLFEVTSELFQNLEQFTCHLYGWKNLLKINKLQNKMFCARIKSNQLPPCKDTLPKTKKPSCEFQSVYLEVLLWLLPNSTHAEKNNSWKNTYSLIMDSMEDAPAPEFLLSNCRRRCDPSNCSCIINDLTCANW